MEFPQGIEKNEASPNYHRDRALYLQVVVDKLLSEHQNRAAEYRAGTLTLAEFKAWEKEDWKPRDKHARHALNLHLEGAGLKGQKNVEPDSEEAEADRVALEAFKAEAKNSQRFNAHFAGKSNKDLVAPWTKGHNAMYEALQRKVRGE